MGSTAITFDPATIKPIQADPSPEAKALQSAVSYASQQSPDNHANLIRLQQLTGVPPVVSQGNEKEVKQAYDSAKINPQWLVDMAPRSSSWASNPDNAAVSGVDEIHRIAGIEQNAAGMRAYTPSWIERSNTAIRNAYQAVTGKTTDQTAQDLYNFPLTRGAIDVAGGAAGLVGNVGSFFGWHGDDSTKRNLLQRVEANLSPEENTDPASLFHKSNQFDWLAKNVAPFIPAMIATGGTSALASTLGLSETAAKVLAGLSVGGMFTADQAGKTFTEVAGSGGSDYQARLAANRVAAINALPNALFGATDVVPFMRNNPLLTSLGMGGITGASGQVSQNIVTGRPTFEGVPSAAIQGAAMQGGLHVGTEAFLGHLTDAVDATEDSKLKDRSPEKFQEAMEQVFQGDESLRIPADKFQEYFQAQGQRPQEVAQSLGAANYAEAVLSGGDVEVPKANFLSQLDSEHQRGLLPDVVDPQTGLTSRQHQEGRDELQQWVDGGGPDKMVAEAAAADAETASSPEFRDLKEDLQKRYTDAGETPKVAETMAEKDANVYSNIAKSANLKPSELVAMYNPKVSIGDIPDEETLNQSGNNPYPLADPEKEGWYANQNYRSTGGRLEYMTPDQYLSKVRPLEIDEESRDNIDSLKNHITSGQTLDPLSIAADGKEDGRHRAVAAKELGIERVPVLRWDAREVLLQSGEDSPRGWFKVNPDGSYEIGRTKIGDFSTFSHESAHAYLHVIGDLATKEGASETLKADHAKILDFLGAKPGEELTTEQQETWARANEQYLREGKAPSSSLRGVFQRFGVWLQSVYRKASDLGVNLSDDIRGVLDRLYAAETGVDRAAAEAGPRMFSSADEAGWTEEQFQNYAEANDVSVEQAKAHILTKLNDARIQEETQAWREEERNVREAVTAEIDQMPSYSAIRQLRKGKLDDGTEFTMNREALVKQFGEERVKELQKQHPGLYRSEGGIDPEAAAEILGYNSAEQMLTDIQDAPRRSAAIEDSTRAYMTAKHGDIRYDGTLQDQARLAVENDKRADLLHRELTALKKKLVDTKADVAAKRAAARDIEVAPIAAYRAAAEQMIEGKAPADLNPTRYLDASRKYSREAFDALRRGDAQEAANAKHKELLNHFLYREAAKAKEYVGRFESYVKRMTSPGVQKSLGLAGSDYRDQFNRILGRYGIGQAVQTERTLSDWTTEQYANGKEPAIDTAILNEARSINYRNAPIAEIRQVHDALMNVRALARQELGMEVNGRKVDFADAVAKMQERAVASVKPRIRPVFDENRSAIDATSDFVHRGTALLARTEFLMKRLDGGTEGPWHDNLWHLAADAQGKEYELQESVTKSVGDALQEMTKEQRLHLTDKVTIEGITEPVTRKRMISMALNMGNEGNRNRLERTFESLGWDVAAVDRVKNSLDREEWSFVQKVWDSLKPLGAAQADLEKRLTGLPPVMVKAEALHVEHSDGTSSDLDGGYYPIVMDPARSERGAQQDVRTNATNMMEAGYGRATTSRGNMKERTGYGGPLLLDHEQVLTQHTAKVVKDISHREFMLAANKFIQDPNIRQTLRDTLGAANEEQFAPWLRTIVNDRNGSTVQGLGVVSRGMNTLRTNIVKAALGFKASTLLLQVTHASSIFLHTSPKSYGQALIDFMAHPNEMTEQIRQLSPNEMSGRGENLDRDMRRVMQDSTSKKSVSDLLARAGMAPVKFMDHIMSFPLWLSVYRDALAERTDIGETEARYQAMQKADGAVRMGLGSNAPKDLSPIMRNNDITKFLTTMGGFHNLKWNQLADAVNTARDGGSAARLTYGVIMAGVIPAVLGALVSGRGPDKDENAGLWAAKKALLFPAETIAILNIGVEALENHGDVRLSPIVSMIEKEGKAISANADDTAAYAQRLGLQTLQTVMEASGVSGTDQLFKTGRYLQKVNAGEVDNANPYDAIIGSGSSKK